MSRIKSHIIGEMECKPEKREQSLIDELKQFGKDAAFHQHTKTKKTIPQPVGFQF